MKRILTGLLFCCSLANCGGLDLSPEMQQFIEVVEQKGSAKEALATYARAETDTADMQIYSFKNPRVIEEQKVDGKHCYIFEAEHKLTLRSYILCWQKKKIVSVEDLGMQ